MTISFQTRPRRFLAILGLGVLGLFLIFHICRHAYLDWCLAHPSMATLKRALVLSPENCKALLEAGVYDSFLTDSKDLAEGERLLRHAVQCQPRDPSAWSSLASALEFTGRKREAVTAAEEAVVLAPRYTPYLWSTGNLLLRAGETEKALDLFHQTLEGSPEYGPAVFRTCWATVSNPKTILQRVVPDTPELNLAYLDFLASAETNKLEAAQEVWERLMHLSARFPPSRAFPYLDALANAGQGGREKADWEEMIRTGILPPAESPTGANLIVNGGFEVQPVDGGLDWRIAPLAGTLIRIDRQTCHGGKRSLAIRFEGLANLDFRNVTEIVPVSPGTTYQFSAYVKGEGISTNSGPRIEISDPLAPGGNHWETPEVLGTTEWSEYQFPIRTGPATRLLKVQVVRVPALGFDSRIEGTLWVDDVRLTPST